jgi:hypothetical protein
MAYDHQMDQLVISAITAATGQGAALSAVAKIGEYAPGHQPVEIRGVSVVVTTTATVTAPVVDFYRRPTAASDTARVLIKRLNPVLASWAAGNTVYSNLEGTTTLSTTINPGEDVCAEVSTAATAGNGHACIMFQTKWQHPANNTKMILV